MKETASALVPVSGGELPPVLAGRLTPEVQERVEGFYSSVAAIFETWVNRRKSEHTRRAYRSDVMAFVRFMGWTWPESATELLRTSIKGSSQKTENKAR